MRETCADCRFYENGKCAYNEYQKVDGDAPACCDFQEN